MAKKSVEGVGEDAEGQGERDVAVVCAVEVHLGANGEKMVRARDIQCDRESIDEVGERVTRLLRSEQNACLPAVSLGFSSMLDDVYQSKENCVVYCGRACIPRTQRESVEWGGVM